MNDHPGAVVRRQFLEAVPVVLLRTMAQAMIDACPLAVDRCYGKYAREIRNAAVGQDRYFDVQTAVEKVAELKRAYPTLECYWERHERATSHYRVVSIPAVRFVFIKVPHSGALPKLHQRRIAKPSQPSLFDNPDKLHAAVVYGFKRGDPATIAFIKIHFVDASGNFYPKAIASIDLLQLLREATPEATVELVDGEIATPMRGVRSIRRNKRNPELGLS